MNDKEDKGCVFLTTGRPGSGKSTALNNVFHLSLATGMAPEAVTTTVEMITSHKFSKTLTVIDTPGLADPRIPEEEVVRGIQEAVSDRDYTLLYCFNVGPGRRVEPEETRIFTILKKALTSKVWHKMVLLLTFSDKIRKQVFLGKDEEYKLYIKEFCEVLSQILKECDHKAPKIEAIFECKGEYVSEEGEHLYNRLDGEDDNIIAIPVERKKDSDNDVLPSVIPRAANWTHLVFMELLRKTDSVQWCKFVALRLGEMYGSFLIRKMTEDHESGNENLQKLESIIGEAMGKSDVRKLHRQIFRGVVLAEKEQKNKSFEDDKQLITSAT